MSSVLTLISPVLMHPLRARRYPFRSWGRVCVSVYGGSKGARRATMTMRGWRKAGECAKEAHEEDDVCERGTRRG
eukprot:1363873-Rhodomonas_salina.1